MVAQRLDGKEFAQRLQEGIRGRVEARLAQGRLAPGLAVIQVGNNPASSVYVHNKHVAAQAVGILSHIYRLPEETTEQTLIATIQQLNQDDTIHGILVQLPLPKHISATHIIDHIDPKKDVDGFHPYNIGRLAQRRPLLRPCTPYGIMKLLAHIDFPFKRASVTIIGASNIVGRPMALELLLAGSTVTTCHRFTPDLPHHLKDADAVIVAIGKPRFVQGEWLKPGAVVIDVGINRLENGKLAGDVDFESASKVASWITPVPGGVGPVTVATLLENTLTAAELLA